MTSATTPSGLGFSNNAYANDPINGGWTSFNLDGNYAHSSAGFTNFEVGYIFTTPKLINKIMFLGQSGYNDRSIKTGQVLASNDTTNGFNGNWVILHNINKNLGDYIDNQFTNFTYINTNQYKAYKIKWLTNFGSTYSVVTQLRFVEKQ